MSEQDAFDRTSALLHEAMLDDAHWLPTAALIDDDCGTKGNMLTFAERNAQDDVEIFHVRFCSHREQDRELERENFTEELSLHEIIALYTKFSRQRASLHTQPLHRPGTENVPGIQRGVTRRRLSKRPQSASGRAARVANFLGDLRSHRYLRRRAPEEGT